MLPQEDLPENRPIIDLQVVREPSHAGRRLFLNARRFIRICHLIQKGAPATGACRAEGVSYQIFRLRVTQNPKYQRRLKQAEEVREHLLREFHIANITRHAAKNVAASMFWLERRYPNEFALRTVVRTNPEDKELQPEIPAEVLARHRALMLELAREDEARAAQKQLTSPSSEAVST
jgi:hypothetical protein